MSTAAPPRGAGAAPRLAPVTVIGAVVEAALLWRFGWSAPLAAYLVFGVAATAVSASDLACRRVPNRATAPALVAGIVLLGVASAHSGQWWSLARAGIATVALAAFYLALGLASRGGMGMGDVKWAGVVGLYCGWLGWRAVFGATLLAFVAAALFVLICRLATVGTRRRTVPMAPFMSAGALAVIVLSR